jgi:anti-sigma regulatory factor (Ser/Thr protein kinase)
VIQETAGRTAQLNFLARNFSLRLSPTPRGARLARLLAREQLRTWDLPYGTAEAAEHLIAELAANAATHGRLPGRDFLLALQATADVLRIEVTDTRGDNLPCPQLPPSEAVSGRGLVLVEALADRWGVELGPVPRKTVWAEIDLSPEPGPPCSGVLPPEHGRPCSGTTGGLPQETIDGQ